jgi:hypothetical protein
LVWMDVGGHEGSRREVAKGILKSSSSSLGCGDSLHQDSGFLDEVMTFHLVLCVYVVLRFELKASCLLTRHSTPLPFGVCVECF